MINILKILYKKTIVGRFIVQIGLDLYHFYVYHIASDKAIIKRRFKQRMGYRLDLNNPKTLNEKINWLKLYYRTPFHTQCADKYGVRDYIKANIGEEYLVPLFLMTKNPKDINAENIPDEPCIIKTNHDSSGGVIVKNKKEINWNALQKIFKNRLSKNYYHRGKEWQYKNIDPCIIVEKLLKGKDGGLPFDYKLHCFHGRVNMIQVDTGRFTDHHHRNWYNRRWEREPYTWSSPKGGKFTHPSKQEVDKPKTLDKMIELTEVIAQDFVYVRVDWYDVEDRLFFGEITFHHDGGTRAIQPREWDLKLGDLLILPEPSPKNHSIS